MLNLSGGWKLVEKVDTETGAFGWINNIAGTNDDHPVLMLNLKQYKEETGFPEGLIYKEYLAALEEVLKNLGGSILWRHPVEVSPVGQPASEVLAIWYPSYAAFVRLAKREVEGAQECLELRQRAVDFESIVGISGTEYPMQP